MTPGECVRQYWVELNQAIQSLDLARVEDAIRLLAQVRGQEKTVFVCGNGGSASTASHFACEIE